MLQTGIDENFTVCVQQYTFFDNQPIAGKSFLRRYDIRRDRIEGQDVAVFTLSTSEEGPSQLPGESGPNVPGDAQAPANGAAAG